MGKPPLPLCTSVSLCNCKNPLLCISFVIDHSLTELVVLFSKKFIKIQLDPEKKYNFISHCFALNTRVQNLALIEISSTILINLCPFSGLRFLHLPNVNSNSTYLKVLLGMYKLLLSVKCWIWSLADNKNI